MVAKTGAVAEWGQSMGLFDKKPKKNEAEEEVVAALTPEEMKKERAAKATSFVMGVEKILPTEAFAEVILLGKMDGSAAANIEVKVCNPGSDNDKPEAVTIIGIQTDEGEVKSTSGGKVALRMPVIPGREYRVGDVIYTDDATLESKVHSYVKALTNTYVADKGLSLSAEEVGKLSITDVEEIWRFYGWFIREIDKEDSEAKKLEHMTKVSMIGNTLCNKIMNADYLYCVFSSLTGEPYMFSRTVRNDDGSYMCTAPNVRVFTESYKERMQEIFKDGKYVIKKIENGDNKQGIYNFFGTVFYLNGAAGVEIISEDTAVTAGSLVKAPDYSKAPKNSIPVTNPMLVRWMLLMGQLRDEDMQKEEGRIIYTLYYNFFAREVVKAKFLVPIHSNSELPAPNEEGRLTLSAGTVVGLPVVDGQNGRKAIRLFTDWRHLYGEFGEKGGAAVETIDSLISTFDCAINLGQFPRAGRYISLASFNEMEEVARKTVAQKSDASTQD